MTSRKSPTIPDTQSDPNEYQVGYKKPPLNSRFKPGKSGNPSGRRATPPSPESSMANLMAGKVLVNENGFPKRITRMQALQHIMFAAAMKGSMRATESIIKLLEKQRAEQATTPKLDLTILSDDELEFLETTIGKVLNPK